MTIKNPFLEKVFLALRPNFFPEYQKEHITLRYYNRVRWDVLIQDAARMEKHLPALIEPIEYSKWKAWGKGQEYEGLLVQNKGGLILDHLQMPHITLPKDSHYPIGANLEPQIVDTLWIGKSINSQYIWAKVSSKQIEVANEQFGFPQGHELTLDSGRKDLP